MTEFTSYQLSVAILLASLYLIYKWLMAGENYHRLNRALLISIYALSFLAIPLNEALQKFPGANLLNPSTEGTVDVGMLSGGIIHSSGQPAPVWPLRAMQVYMAGVAVTFAFTIVSLIRLMIIIRRNDVERIEGYRVVVADNIKYAPFSIGNIIVLSHKDLEEAGGLVFLHEKSHIRLHHWIDLLIAQCVCILQWFNPASWLMREELRTVHEYQADSRVIRGGAGIKEYQMLLIKKAVGARFPSLANSLNHSKLKKRITMMYNQKKTRGRAMRAIALAPALAAALWITRTPAVASVIEDFHNASNQSVPESPETFGKNSENLAFLQAPHRSAPQSEGHLKADLAAESETAAPAPEPVTKVSEKAEEVKGNKEKEEESKDVFVTCEVMPEYEGGFEALMRFLSQNIHYPKEAYEKDIQGRVIVKFVVEKNGEVGDVEVIRSVNPALDAEAVRVTRLLKFKPGLINGKPVASYFNLPIAFKLSEKETKEETTVIAH